MRTARSVADNFAVRITHAVYRELHYDLTPAVMLEPPLDVMHGSLLFDPGEKCLSLVEVGVKVPYIDG